MFFQVLLKLFQSWIKDYDKYRRGCRDSSTTLCPSVGDWPWLHRSVYAPIHFIIILYALFYSCRCEQQSKIISEVNCRTSFVYLCCCFFYQVLYLGMLVCSLYKRVYKWWNGREPGCARVLLECAGSVRTCACRISQVLKSLGHNSPIPGHFLVCARRVCRLTNDLRMRVRKAISHSCTPAFHAVSWCSVVGWVAVPAVPLTKCLSTLCHMPYRLKANIQPADSSMCLQLLDLSTWEWSDAQWNSSRGSYHLFHGEMIGTGCWQLLQFRGWAGTVPFEVSLRHLYWRQCARLLARPRFYSLYMT